MEQIVLDNEQGVLYNKAVGRTMSSTGVNANVIPNNKTLRDLRTTNGWTQAELGALLGVTPDYISQIERGRIPGMKTARKLAGLLGIGVDELFPLDEHQGQKEASQ